MAAPGGRSPPSPPEERERPLYLWGGDINKDWWVCVVGAEAQGTAQGTRRLPGVASERVCDEILEDL